MKLTPKIFNSHPKADGDFFWGIRKIVGFRPKDLGVYKKAFLHRSMNKKDENGNPMNYERLEFLGDSMFSIELVKSVTSKAYTIIIQESSGRF